MKGPFISLDGLACGIAVNKKAQFLNFIRYKNLFYELVGHGY